LVEIESFILDNILVVFLSPLKISNVLKSSKSFQFYKNRWSTFLWFCLCSFKHEQKSYWLLDYFMQWFQNIHQENSEIWHNLLSSVNPSFQIEKLNMDFSSELRIFIQFLSSINLLLFWFVFVSVSKFNIMISFKIIRLDKS
jgi:hypothetical protein